MRKNEEDEEQKKTLKSTGEGQISINPNSKSNNQNQKWQRREKEKEKKTKRTFDPGPDAFIILLFNTSAGEHTVVATVPAAKLAVKWHSMLSSNIWVLMSSALKKSYLMDKRGQYSVPNWIGREKKPAGRREQKERSAHEAS